MGKNLSKQQDSGKVRSGEIRGDCPQDPEVLNHDPTDRRDCPQEVLGRGGFIAINTLPSRRHPPDLWIVLKSGGEIWGITKVSVAADIAVRERWCYC